MGRIGVWSRSWPMRGHSRSVARSSDRSWSMTWLAQGISCMEPYPTMTYIIGRSGRVLFRSDWTDPPTLTLFLKYLLDVRARRRAGERLAGFYAEFMGYRTVDPAKFQQGLEVADPQAVEDFARTMQHWTSQGKIPSRMEG